MGFRFKTSVTLGQAVEDIEDAAGPPASAATASEISKASCFWSSVALSLVLGFIGLLGDDWKTSDT